jgi:hypothetical protein
MGCTGCNWEHPETCRMCRIGEQERQAAKAKATPEEVAEHNIREMGLVTNRPRLYTPDPRD